MSTIADPQLRADPKGRGGITREPAESPQNAEAFLLEQALERDQEFASLVLVPWREASERARSTDWPREGVPPLALASESRPLNMLAATAYPHRPSWAPHPLDFYDYSGYPAQCFGTWEMVPPFDVGLPTVERIVAGPPTYAAGTSIVNREQGKMSLGVAIGAYSGDRWLGSYDPVSGVSRRVMHGYLQQTLQLPGPVQAATRVELSVDVTVPWRSESLWRSVQPNALGPAGVAADISMTGFSLPLGRTITPDHVTFAEDVRDQALGQLSYTRLAAFGLHAVHVLRPGATAITVGLLTRLSAFVSGRVEDIGNGFAGLDLRSSPLDSQWRPPQAALWPISFGGGPITVPRIRTTFCRLGW
jgi:hypothetical protein